MVFDYTLYSYNMQRVCSLCGVYRSEEASNEMEALARASHNPDEIVLGEDDEEQET